ncbi:MAG: beta-ketoacyl-ACP synthase II [Candidatus Cloacimonetes bacterium]|nr:beta-ketoacyl-ACP synthase II [Candidatus Cloacimonadota bacterium]
MGKRRVVITGLGTLNALGKNTEETWARLLKGDSGIELIKGFEITDEFSSRIAGEVKNYDPQDFMDRKRARKLDKYAQFALITAREALEDSGLTEFDHDRAGVIIASGIGGMSTFEEETTKLVKLGPRKISPFFIPKMISNIASAEVAIEFNFRSVNYNITSACASANHALGSSYRAIQYGDADIMLTGGAEASVTRLAVAGFCSMKALSTRNDEPEKASRPFDLERDGFIMAEGAGCLILEEYEHARRRGARIYAEIVGYGATCDAYHITAPAEQGEGGSRAIHAALDDAGLKPEEIDYINAHGTSTPLNDKNETYSIKNVFGPYSRKVKISSTKSMVGHTLGAAAGIEAIACCKTIQTGQLHPTINYEFPDPECDLDYIPNKAISMNVNYVLSNSLGFGGHNAVLIFKKPE